MYFCQKVGVTKLPVLYQNNPQFRAVYEGVCANGSVTALGLIGSKHSFLVKSLFEQHSNTTIWVLNNKEEAAYFLNDLEVLLPNPPLFYPSSYRRPYNIEETDNANVLLRAETLQKLKEHTKQLVVTYPEALFEQVLTPKELKRKTLSINKGDELSIDFVNETLFEFGFNRVDFVAEPGEFAVRGGILDVHSFSHDEPFRIEFFGDEVDTIRTFDVTSQRSIQLHEQVKILANIEQKENTETRQSLLSFVSENTLVCVQNESIVTAELDALFKFAQKEFEKLSGEIKRQPPKELFIDGKTFTSGLESLPQVHFSSAKKTHSLAFSCQPQPHFKRKFDWLAEHLTENTEQQRTNHIFCASETQKERLTQIIEELAPQTTFHCWVAPLYQGFVDEDENIVCYTDHQLFERYHKFRLKNGYSKKQAISLKALAQLEVGDYVTHIDHGIGTFGGLQRIDVEGKTQEAIKLFYGDRDILYVSIHSLHKISKFNGKDGAVPKVYKLGSGAWKKIKQKTKKKVKEIAFNLINVYAKRRINKGFACGPDTYLQHELEASFLFEDTPDQRTATEAVKQDMEDQKPMDRLVCGDVGFGKTEVAIRAAFKAVDNGKQVAVLVPTTILAFQHYNTFLKRLKEFPVTVDYLNRFRTAKQKKEVLEGIDNGAIDIVIGTHQLVGKSVSFKDLGLLIVDEEQKFGVNVKEKLRSLKEHVDVLTLTATPIPRTLQFSLMAARDLSVINTPPPNRYPIESQVISWSETQIRDAVIYELQRGGQVFFVHNRIENIGEVSGMLQRLIPDARIATAHGQLPGNKLEELMLGFIEGAFDVLVATTIIESGLDVPNANTIFINNANNFGLSDLHQMRGRVGRSNKKAFCYFITPPFSVLTDDARKRMEAVNQYTALGSGFQIAMKDLEIRGAGDLLGGEQSGFINDIGFETYQKILKDAIEELQQNEFKALYPNQKPTVKELVLDTDFEIFFPTDYINNVTERLTQYQELATLKTEEELTAFGASLIDRFGALPEPTIALFESVRLKWLGASLGFEKIILKKQKCICTFLADPESSFYQEDAFQFMLGKLGTLGKAQLKEKNTKEGHKLVIVINDVLSIQSAIILLQKLQKPITA
ncbi:MAG: transcription-repair coupling factor [Flavobacteriaceae bacterium]